MCPSGATCLPDCCFSELALNNPTQRIGLEQSRPRHHLIENYIVLAMMKLLECEQARQVS
jgi:hypothetical protein